MEALIGHERLQAFFADAIANNRLTHAYCLVGPRHVGKTTLARWCASQLLQVPFGQIDQAADLLQIGLSVDEKTGKLKKDVTIEQIRSVVAFASQSAFQSQGAKVIIITDVELMNRAAANALLKSLEEAHPRTYFFLVAHNAAAVLPTIQSRCVTIEVTVVPKKVLTAAAQLCDSEEKELMIASARGLPGRLVTWMTYSETWVQEKKFQSDWHYFFGKPWYEKNAVIEALLDTAEDTSFQRALARTVLERWQEYITASENALSNTIISNVAERIRIASNWIDAAVAPKAALEYVILAIP